MKVTPPIRRARSRSSSRLDTSLAILDALYEEYRDPNYAAVPLLRRLVTSGQLGRKTKKGFYDYNR